MAVVLEAMPFSATWSKRQNRIQAIQRLDGALLVHAEDSGMRRWFEVQADDVRRFLFKLRIITGHIPRCRPYHARSYAAGRREEAQARFHYAVAADEADRITATTAAPTRAW
jgi:hypothetical protein